MIQALLPVVNPWKFSAIIALALFSFWCSGHVCVTPATLFLVALSFLSFFFLFALPSGTFPRTYPHALWVSSTAVWGLFPARHRHSSSSLQWFVWMSDIPPHSFLACPSLCLPDHLSLHTLCFFS